MSERAELPWWATLLLIPLLNLAAAFAVSAVILVAIGENPFQAGAIILDALPAELKDNTRLMELY